MRNCTALLLATLLVFIAHAQTAATAIYVRAAVRNDTAFVRWVPASPEVWTKGNAVGYRVERFTVDAYFDLGANAAGKGTLITPVALKPLSKDDPAWASLQQREPMARLVWEQLYAPKPFTGDAKQRELQRQTTFGFTLKACDYSPEVAAAHGLLLKDATVKRGEVYIYVVSLAVPDANHKPGIGKADPKQDAAPAVKTLSARSGNRFAMLSFDAAATRSAYAGYIIERSADSLNFVRLNASLLVFAASTDEQQKTELSWKDSLPQNGRSYWYRVRGYSYFGFSGAPSPVVRVRGKEEWAAFPEIDSGYSADNQTVQLRWRLPAGMNIALLNRQVILRAGKAAGPYRVVPNGDALSKTVTAFTDPAPDFTNYYLVAAVSTEGDTAFSYPALVQLADNTPPPVPAGLEGAIDTNGVVLLRWNAVTAADLRGYRVFRCNHRSEEFVEISDTLLTATQFRDSIVLQTLTREVYYTVRAVDRVYNNSRNAAALCLRRPDIVPPVAPLFTLAVHTDSSIVLRWIPSSSGDVSAVHLLRSTAAGSEAVRVHTFSGSDTTCFFIDFSALPDGDYRYQLVCVDSSDNQSRTESPVVVFRPRIRPAVKDVKAIADAELHAIVVTWAAPSGDVDRVVLYRSVGDAPFVTYETLVGTAVQFVDRRPAVGNVYRYRVKVVYRSGAESALSAPVGVGY